MKKLVCLILAVFLLGALLAGCDKTETLVTHGMTTVLDTTEYVLYQNIFFNGQSSAYTDKPVTKKGTFTVLFDAYNDRTRYYVWGYNDMTMCCDWQWEFVPRDAASLPAVGSVVEVTGTFTGNKNALDKFWIDDAAVSLVKEYKGVACDMDLTTMSGTLERVEIQNMQVFPAQFAGKTVSAYGRVNSPSSFQHPYYDNCFAQAFQTDDPVPAIGIQVIVTGTWQADGTITSATVTELAE